MPVCKASIPRIPGNRFHAPPTPTMAPNEYVATWGGYKVESSRYTQTKPGLDSAIQSHSRPNFFGQPSKGHVQTHDPATGQPLPRPRPGKGPTETFVAVDNVPNTGNGQKTTAISGVRNDGRPGGVGGTNPTANLQYVEHSHPYKNPGNDYWTPSGGVGQKSGDIQALRKLNQSQQAFHQAAKTGSTAGLSGSDLQIWNAMDEKTQAGYKNRPPRVEGFISAPNSTPSDMNYRKDSKIKFDENNMYHTMVPKPYPNYPTPPNTPVGGTPAFHHPPTGSQTHPPGPPGPPQAGGYTYPGGSKYAPANWDPMIARPDPPTNV